MSRFIDTIVVGGGIAGLMSAYFLQKEGVDVVLLEKSGLPATGGSGAAGAFISPKIGKGSPLQELTNEAFLFAKEFYAENFANYFRQTGIIRIPKAQDDATAFETYANHNKISYQWVDTQRYQEFGISENLKGFLFEEAGVCDAQGLADALWRVIPHAQFDLKEIRFAADEWYLGGVGKETEYRAKAVVLATGYQNSILDMRYMGVKGTWGSRGDFVSDLPLEKTLHKSISISANLGGIIKVGATHIKTSNPCLYCDNKPVDTLLSKADELIDSNRLTLKKPYCGMRAGSKDYAPLVGKVVDTTTMLSSYPKIITGATPPLVYHKNLYICNGFGGRGFVFAPRMAHMLTQAICHNQVLDTRINPDRLFYKWCRKKKPEPL